MSNFSGITAAYPCKPRNTLIGSQASRFVETMNDEKGEQDIYPSLLKDGFGRLSLIMKPALIDRSTDDESLFFNTCKEYC